MSILKTVELYTLNGYVDYISLGLLKKMLLQKGYSVSRVKQITSPGWMHETSALTWCTGKTQRDRAEREVGVGIGMGNTCKSMANSCQCMKKTTTIL